MSIYKFPKLCAHIVINHAHIIVINYYKSRGKLVQPNHINPKKVGAVHLIAGEEERSFSKILVFCDDSLGGLQPVWQRNLE